MRLYWKIVIPIVVVIVGLIIATAVVIKGTKKKTNKSTEVDVRAWQSCPILSFPHKTNDKKYSEIKAECNNVTAPLCYEGICEDEEKRTLQLFVKRIPATAPKKNNQSHPVVWLVQGGPGESSVECALRH